jgi:hypothetical protein
MQLQRDSFGSRKGELSGFSDENDAAACGSGFATLLPWKNDVKVLQTRILTPTSSKKSEHYNFADYRVYLANKKICQSRSVDIASAFKKHEDVMRSQRIFDQFKKMLYK